MATHPRRGNLKHPGQGVAGRDPSIQLARLHPQGGNADRLDLPVRVELHPVDARHPVVSPLFSERPTPALHHATTRTATFRLSPPSSPHTITGAAHPAASLPRGNDPHPVSEKPMRFAATLFASLAPLLVCTRADAELLYATSGNDLARFDSGATGVVTSAPVTGLQAGEPLVGVDVRPANQLLYGLGSSSRLYTINPLTGAATPVGAAGAF